MKNRTGNRVSMLHATLALLKENPAITATIPALGTAISEVETKLTAVNQLNQTALASVKGVTKDTNAIRSAMTALAFKCGSAVSAYASSVSNNDLRVKVTFTVRTLSKMKKEEAGSVCQVIRNEAQANIAAAGAFGYTAADVTALQNAIHAFRAAAANPRLAIIAKTRAVADIDKAVRALIIKFKREIDKMVNTLKENHPAFVSQYYSAREIIDLGHTFTKVRGIVNDENKTPLAGVRVALREPHAKRTVNEAVSQSRGKFHIRKIAPGNYDLIWMLDGYKTVIEPNVRISPGKELRRRLTMLRA